MNRIDESRTLHLQMDHWLSRRDAMAIGRAIAMSESWPRRLLLSMFVQTRRLTRLADRWVCSVEVSRNNRPVKPVALAYLKKRTGQALMDQVQLHHEYCSDGYGSDEKDIIHLHVLSLLLGAGYLADRARARIEAERSATERSAQIAADQQKALGRIGQSA